MTYRVFTDVEVSDLKFGPVIKDNKGNGGGGTMFQDHCVFINNEEGGQFSFQMNTGYAGRSRCPFGVSGLVVGEEDKGKYSLEMESTEELSAFLTKFSEHVKKQAVANSIDWFKKPMTPAEVNHMFVSPLKQQDGRSDKVKMKISPRTVFDRIVEVKDGQVRYQTATKEDLLPNSKAMVWARMNRIWFSKQEFGVQIAIQRILIDPPESAVAKGFAF